VSRAAQILHVLIRSISSQTAALYARLRLQLKDKGKPIPENDLWIAASCVDMM
jgi:tRNA(fMet)-specific endonuclease VapC